MVGIYVALVCWCVQNTTSDNIYNVALWHFLKYPVLCLYAGVAGYCAILCKIIVNVDVSPLYIV